VNDLSKVGTQLWPGENRTHDLMIASSTLYCDIPVFWITQTCYMMKWYDWLRAVYLDACFITQIHKTNRLDYIPIIICPALIKEEKPTHIKQQQQWQLWKRYKTQLQLTIIISTNVNIIQPSNGQLSLATVWRWPQVLPFGLVTIGGLFRLYHSLCKAGYHVSTFQQRGYNIPLKHVLVLI